ncbi:glycerophosphodiester phosphodiesterase [Candidatus Sumerlaeota bacterium]|nr:glycerophosphodiester phosphodiesterase [Candidatus Sumerlaeota bacterium]
MLILFLTAVVALSGCVKGRRPEIIAHRGASAVAPENTIAAYRLAWEMGADGAETDVHLTKDGKVVALHDKTTKRTAGLDRAIKDLTWDEVRALDAGSWKSPKYAGEKIPSLAEVLETLPPGKKLYLEIKSTKEIVPFLKTIVEESGKRKQVVLIAFDKKTLLAAKAALPGVHTKWLIDSPRDAKGKRGLAIDPAFAAQAKAAGFDGLNVSHLGVTPELVKAANDAGQELHVWTVDNPQRARLLVEMGVVGITTNAPDVMLKEFGR